LELEFCFSFENERILSNKQIYLKMDNKKQQLIVPLRFRIIQEGKLNFFSKNFSGFLISGVENFQEYSQEVTQH
jgi:hypothetical protein